MWDNRRPRIRAAASLVATAALVGTTASVTSSPALSAEPAGDCAEAYPVSEVTDGQAVEGLTVSKGTTPEEFTGEVIGVIDDGIAPGLDMVMAELTSPAIQAAAPSTPGGTIWAGMSGSPVYAEDGRLIGAVAYGLSWGPSNVAGITPFEEMDDYLPEAPASKVPVSASQARAIARSSSVTEEQASEGFSQLRVQQRVSGLTSQRIEQLRSRPRFRKNDYLAKKFAGIGGTMAKADPGAETLGAGGNLAVTMSYGDITQGGVGTTTSVCGGGLVGFGHPATFLGDTTLTMHPATAVYVQPESLGAAFKVANFGAPAGTISGDHLSGVSGTFGALPATTTVTSTVAYDGRERTGSSSVSVPQANASTTFYQQLANHDRVLDGILAGSEELTWQVAGTDADGSPFTLGMTDRYTSGYDIAYESPWELADLVYVLSSLEGVSLDSVTAAGTVTDDSSVWKLTSVEQRKGGEWVKINRRRGVVARPGHTLALRANLEGPAGTTRVVPLAVDVPDQIRRRAALVVSGGAYMYSDFYGAGSVDEIVETVESAVRNDQVAATLYSGRRTDAGRTVSEPTEHVVQGEKYFFVRVQK